MQKLLYNIVLLLLSLNCLSQDCTREIAQTVPTILEKGFDNKPYAVKDIDGKKLGDSLYSLFASSIQQSKGLHGNFNISAANNHLPGLQGYHAYAMMFFCVYCRKDGNFDWKGLSALSFECTSNDIIKGWGEELRNDLIGVGGDYFVYLNNNIVYKLEPRRANSELGGYPFIEAPRSNANNTVFITKRGTAFFLPVTRRQYLELMKKNAEMSLAVQKKSLAESIKEKLGIEAAITPLIEYYLNDIKQIDAFIAEHSDENLNKPCITNHNLESLFGKSFTADAAYFFDAPGLGKEWVIINPGYINKKLSPSLPQFFSFSWSQGEKEAEKKAALLFKQIFDFKKLGDLLQWLCYAYWLWRYRWFAYWNYLQPAVKKGPLKSHSVIRQRTEARSTFANPILAPAE